MTLLVSCSYWHPFNPILDRVIHFFLQIIQTYTKPVLTEILYSNTSSPHYSTEGHTLCGGSDPSLINKPLSLTDNGVAACQTCIHLDDDCWTVFITLLHIRWVGDIVHIWPLRLIHCLDDSLVQGYLLISNGTSL